MAIKNYICLAIIFGFLCLNPALAFHKYNNNNNAVKLQDVQVLTLRKGDMTTGRRLDPILQLKCVGGNAFGHLNEVKAVQCQNMGWDGSDVNWKCSALLDDKLKLRRTNILCEGYNYPDDPYILEGSCGLEFELEYSKSSKQKYNPRIENSGISSIFGLILFAGLFLLIFIIPLCVLFECISHTSCYLTGRRNTHSPRTPSLNDQANIPAPTFTPNINDDICHPSHPNIYPHINPNYDYFGANTNTGADFIPMGPTVVVNNPSTYHRSSNNDFTTGFIVGSALSSTPIVVSSTPTPVTKIETIIAHEPEKKDNERVSETFAKTERR